MMYPPLFLQETFTPFQTATDQDHIHIKDVEVDTPRSLLKVKKFGEGQLGALFQPISDALREDEYDGIVSFESVYHPGNRDFEAGFRKCIDSFKQVFGDAGAMATV